MSVLEQCRTNSAIKCHILVMTLQCTTTKYNLSNIPKSACTYNKNVMIVNKNCMRTNIVQEYLDQQKVNRMDRKLRESDIYTHVCAKKTGDCTNV